MPKLAITTFAILSTLIISISCGMNGDDSSTALESPEILFSNNYFLKETYGVVTIPPYSGTLYVLAFPNKSTYEYSNVKLYLDGIEVASDDGTGKETDNRFRFKWQVSTLSIGNHSMQVKGIYQNKTEIISKPIYFNQDNLILNVSETVDIGSSTVSSTVTSSTVVASTNWVVSSGDYSNSNGRLIRNSGSGWSGYGKIIGIKAKPGHGFEIDNYDAMGFAYQFMLQRVGQASPGTNLTSLHKSASFGTEMVFSDAIDGTSNALSSATYPTDKVKLVINTEYKVEFYVNDVLTSTTINQFIADENLELLFRYFEAKGLNLTVYSD